MPTAVESERERERGHRHCGRKVHRQTESKVDGFVIQRSDIKNNAARRPQNRTYEQTDGTGQQFNSFAEKGIVDLSIDGGIENLEGEYRVRRSDRL